MATEDKRFLKWRLKNPVCHAIAARRHGGSSFCPYPQHIQQECPAFDGFRLDASPQANYARIEPDSECENGTKMCVCTHQLSLYGF